MSLCAIAKDRPSPPASCLGYWPREHKTSDNTNIFVRNCGVAAAGDSVVRIVPDIEAPTSGSYSWPNTTELVGTRAVQGDKITLAVYDVSKAAAGNTKIELEDPPGVPNNSWDCVGGSGTRGDSVFTENVTLGSSFSISNAKRGSRNIIPITGGTTTGKVSGKILDGGADYQLAGSSGTTLDARYTLAPSDGNFIIVRNCGPIDALVPAFEAAVDGALQILDRWQVSELSTRRRFRRRQYHLLRPQVAPGAATAPRRAACSSTLKMSSSMSVMSVMPKRMPRATPCPGVPG